MANKSSFLLAVLFIANPFVLLFYQNCSSAPHHKASYQNSFSDKNRTLSSAETPSPESIKPSY